MKPILLILLAYICQTGAFSNNVSHSEPEDNSTSTTKLLSKTNPEIKKSVVLTYSYYTDSASCYGFNDGKARVFISGGTTPYSYMWSNQSTSSETIGLSAGSYSVTITDFNQEKIIINNILILQPLPIAVQIFGEHLQNDESWICIGETEKLNCSATGGVAPYTFYWSNNQVSNTISVSPTIANTYSAYAIDLKGCIGHTTEIKVNVFEAITISATATPNTICKGEEVSINIDASGGNGNYQYHLESGTSSQDINSTLTLHPQASRNYTLKVTDICNSPSAEQTLTVAVNPIPEVDFSAEETAGCQPFETTFENNTDLDKNKYLWKFEANNLQSYISTQENPDFTFEKLGQYHVNLQVTSEHGCFSEQTEYNYITVFQSPKAQFEPEYTTRSTINTEIFFNNYSNYSDQSLWIFDDLDSSRLSSPLHAFPEIAGEYEVKLIASNRYGCSDEAYETIKIIDEIAFHMPTAFSPNGDGLNELFFVSGNGMTNIDFYFAVYNRWGNKIFHTNDYNDAWNGQVLGQLATKGVYTWIVRFTDTQQIKYEKTGQVTLLR